MASRIKPGTLYVLYRGDDVFGVFNSINEISSLMGQTVRTVKQWQTPSWKERVDNLDPMYRDKAYLIERVEPDLEDAML